MKKALFILLFCVYLAPVCFPVQQGEEFSTPSGTAVGLNYRALQPGETIAVTLKDSSTIQEAQVLFSNRRYPMGRIEESGELLAFIPLGLELEPGLYPMEVVIGKAGVQEAFRIQVSVTAKEFPLKKLWVNERYLKPPPEFAERIRLESQMLSVIYGIATERWLAEGRFVLPASGEVNSSFGERRVFNEKHNSTHGGVDITEPYGAAVKASNSGRVVLASDLYFSGKTVIIDHGLGVFTVYCHFSKIRVKRGESVRKGDIIGEVGATGRATGPHLHWGMKIFGKSVDPFSLLSLSLE